TVDLAAKTVSWGGQSAAFDMDDYTRWRLLEGLDDIDLTLRQQSLIDDYERRRPHWSATTV
ncbi:MAG: 3-isopropylmalate/(R)-2-methylmalate dehydratase small subunit, partial [Actinomycetota bacterium]|nr:3-isopropylmalate/(R)-2-methylmalate dehydratase small subunit [Actinomycetota bacterium]